jgi:thioredoxin reductase (NADPH)
MSQYLVDQINETKNIDVMLSSSNIEVVKGEERLESVIVYNSRNEENTTFPISSIFIFIGAQPRTDWLAGVIERDRNGFILTGPDLMPNRNSRPQGWTVDREPFLLETNIPGVFAAGDVRLGSVKRVASGVGEGAIAIQFVHQYLTKV